MSESKFELPEGYRLRTLDGDDGFPDTYYVEDDHGREVTRDYADTADALAAAEHALEYTASLRDDLARTCRKLADLTSEKQQLEGALARAIEYARTLLRNVPEHHHDGTTPESEVDGLGRQLHGDGYAGADYVMVAVTRACCWMEDLNVALGQIRSLARTGLLGGDPLTSQNSREQEAGVSDGGFGYARPGDAVLDVAVELARLARGLPRGED